MRGCGAGACSRVGGGCRGRTSGGGRTTSTLIARGWCTTAVGRLVVVAIIIIFYSRGRGATDGKTAWEVVGTRDGAGHTHGARRTTDGGTNWHRGRKGTVGGIKAGLDEVLAFRLGDERLKLGGGKGVD